jgi:predicted small secreted protein
MRRRALAIAVVLLSAALCGCAAAAGAGRGSTAHSSGRVLRWTSFVHAPMPVDLAGPGPDGSLVVAAARRLWRLSPAGRLRPIAPAYRGAPGEPYIVLPEQVGRHRACFGSQTVYALELGTRQGVLAIPAGAKPHELAHLRAPGLLNGIAFDQTGRFGYRLLVTIASGSHTRVLAIGCQGHVTTITASAPRVEGGIVVAPGHFGPFGGDLIAPDELSGNIYAITPTGRSILVARSGLPHGQDIGVESESFVPSGKRFDVLVSDRLTPGNPHPGDNLILALRSGALRSAGVHAGDMLVVSEAGAMTDVVRCAAGGCRARHIAGGPAIAHIEGHVAVLPR